MEAGSKAISALKRQLQGKRRVQFEDCGRETEFGWDLRPECRVYSSYFLFSGGCNCDCFDWPRKALFSGSGECKAAFSAETAEIGLFDSRYFRQIDLRANNWNINRSFGDKQKLVQRHSRKAMLEHLLLPLY